VIPKRCRSFDAEEHWKTLKLAYLALTFAEAILTLHFNSAFNSGIVLLHAAANGNIERVSIMSNEFNRASDEEKAEIDILIKHMQDSGLDAVKPLDLLRGLEGNPYERYKQAQTTIRWGRPAFVLMKAEGLDLEKVTIGELGREISLERLIALRSKMK
jgi:hypothetical protein